MNIGQMAEAITLVSRLKERHASEIVQAISMVQFFEGLMSRATSLEPEMRNLMSRRLLQSQVELCLHKGHTAEAFASAFDEMRQASETLAIISQIPE